LHNAATPSFQEGRSNNASSTAAAACGDDDDDVDEAAAAALKQLESTSNSVLDFAAANFLPIALVTGVAVGLTFPQPGQLMQQWGVSKWTTSAIFVISGLTLSTGDVAKAAKAWPAVLFGLVSILFITPLMAVPVLRLNLVPRELVTGLAIFCCVPTTLTSGVSLTQVWCGLH
jgi:predicted Na+-dependent transporter